MVQLRHRHHRPRRPVFAQESGIEAVEGRPVLDAGDIDGHLEQILRPPPCRGQDGAEVVQGDLGLLSETRGDRMAAVGSYRQLPGYMEQPQLGRSFGIVTARRRRGRGLDEARISGHAGGSRG